MSASQHCEKVLRAVRFHHVTWGFFGVMHALLLFFLFYFGNICLLFVCLWLFFFSVMSSTCNWWSRSNVLHHSLIACPSPSYCQIVFTPESEFFACVLNTSACLTACVLTSAWINLVWTFSSVFESAFWVLLQFSAWIEGWRLGV